MSAGAEDRLDVYEHAAMLGGGFESLLGFAEGAVETGRGHEGRVFVAACRSVALTSLQSYACALAAWAPACLHACHA